MPHFFESGFSVRQPVWHNMAEILQDYPGREEAMKIAGHDFTIVEAPLDAMVDKGRIPVKDWKALVKAEETIVLGVVRDTYEVLQNDVLWDIVDAIVGQENVKYETAGVLRKGQVIWVLARLDEPVTIEGDTSPVYPYCLVSTSHDGTGACRAQAVSVRVVCWNTLQSAENQARGSGLSYTFRHTKQVMTRIEEAKKALAVTREQHAGFMEVAEELAGRVVTEDGVKDFLSRFVPEPEEAFLSDRVRLNIREARFQIYDLLDGDTIPATHRRTGWGLYNAAVEYLDHLRKFRNPETYFGRCMMSSSAIKSRTVELVRDCSFSL